MIVHIISHCRPLCCHEWVDHRAWMNLCNTWHNLVHRTLRHYICFYWMYTLHVCLTEWFVKSPQPCILDILLWFNSMYINEDSRRIAPLQSCGPTTFCALISSSISTISSRMTTFILRGMNNHILKLIRKVLLHKRLCNNFLSNTITLQLCNSLAKFAIRFAITSLELGRVLVQEACR